METFTRSTPDKPGTEHAHDDDEPILGVQFDDVEQQHESSIIGMWLFLATEVMFFGGLIAAYTVYRYLSPTEVTLASHHLSVAWGAFNTVILLGSSLTMALAVRAAQLHDRRQIVMWLIPTAILGTMFLGVKGIEWTTDYHENLVPAMGFHVPHEDLETHPDLDPGRYQMFFVLYFFMTGLHAIHLIIGVVLVGIMAYLSHRNWFSGSGVTQIDVTGLYWHFIDIVWVFLYPLLYLVSSHASS